MQETRAASPDAFNPQRKGTNVGEGRSSDSSSEVWVTYSVRGVHSRSGRVLHDGPVAGEAVESLHELSGNKHKDKSSVLLSPSPAAYI